jgi:GTP-binding protein
MTDDEAERQALEEGRLLFAAECGFINGSTRLDTLPEAVLPEIAFAGRSNVGKSSLLNALTNRKDLARISKTPGRTQQLNFFDLGHRLILVDMPGYGYAEAAKSAIEAWTRLIEAFLRGRATLRRACVLIDARHGLKPVDEPLLKLLDAAAVNFQLVLTKCDKLKPAELERRRGELAEVARRHRAAHPDVPTVSSHDGTGIPALRAALAALAVPRPVG